MVVDDAGTAGSERGEGDRAQPAETGADDGERERLRPEEAALLEAFDRLSPEGSVEWRFDEALRRLDRPDHTSASLYPWAGVPDDLWERGRAARVGQRFVGDVAAALADHLAADARRAADAAVAAGSEARFLAAYDALRYLAARVAALEDRVDPTGLAPADFDLPLFGAGEWAGSLGGWLGAGLDVPGPLVVGEARDATLMSVAKASGRPFTGVEPRGALVWDELTADAAFECVISEVGEHLASLADDAVAGVVAAGVPDRVDLVAKCALARHALRVTKPGGRVVLLVCDPARWDDGVGLPTRDLLPGRPLHPETWTLLLQRLGASTVTWHQPAGGSALHALVVEVGG